MITLVMVSTKFDTNDITKVKGPFVNMLTDFDKISVETACRWQKYLSRCAAEVELESTVWAEGVMKYNMNDELKTLVHDSMEETDTTGAIVMYKLMTDHMVLRNQESIDALLKWIQHFDIGRYDGQNVKLQQVKFVQ